jgi:hypothetical protein
VFENGVLRGIFGPKRDKMIEGWRELRNEELHNLYSLPNIITVIKSRRIRWVGHAALMGEKRTVYRVLVGMPEGKTPLGTPSCKLMDNIKMELREIGCGGMDWIHLA